MNYVWTEQLRDALLTAEVREHVPDDAARDLLTQAVIVLASIPLGATLDVSDDEPDGDVGPAPTGDYVHELAQYHYGNTRPELIR